MRKTNCPLNNPRNNHVHRMYKKIYTKFREKLRKDPKTNRILKREKKKETFLKHLFTSPLLFSSILYEYYREETKGSRIKSGPRGTATIR